MHPAASHTPTQSTPHTYHHLCTIHHNPSPPQVVRSNAIGARGALALARGLSSLTSLDLTNCPIGRRASKQLERIENREIVQAYKQWRGLQEWVRTRVLATLQELAWITPAAGQQAIGKRQPTIWDVNPAAHEHYAGLAEKEREKRERLRERLRELGR